MKFEIKKTDAEKLIREFVGQPKSTPVLDKVLEELSNVNGGEIENDNIEISEISNDAVYPAEVRIEKMQYSISHINTLLNKRKDLILNPKFQRNNVWSDKQKSELIESILMGIPIPVIYLFENQMGKRQVVDGKQRITAVTQFINNEFELKNLVILSDLNGCSFDELSPKHQGVFEDFQLFCYVIQPPTPERIKYDIFDRVNRGGTSLNKQEMRNALYGGRCVSILDDICKSEHFLNATGSSLRSARMKDQYAALRVWALLLLKIGCLKNEGEKLKYKGDIDVFLANFMCYVNECADDTLILEYKNMLLSALDRCHKVLGYGGFRFSGKAVRRPINMPLMEALVYYFYRKDDISDIHNIKKQIEIIKNQFDESKYFSGNIDSTTSIDYRFGEIDKLLNLHSND